MENGKSTGVKITFTLGIWEALEELYANYMCSVALLCRLSCMCIICTVINIGTPKCCVCIYVLCFSGPVRLIERLTC